MRTGANMVIVSVTIARQLRMRTVRNTGTASVLVARIRVSNCSLTWRLIKPKKDMLKEDRFLLVKFFPSAMLHIPLQKLVVRAS